MKVAVLSDIHANFPALAAVLEDADSQGIDLQSRAVWCLGDVVGYGPHPREALTFLREFADPKAWVLGNHDAMLADLIFDDEANFQKIKTHQIALEKGQGEQVSVRGNLLSIQDWILTTAEPVDTIRKNRSAIQTDPELDAYWKKNFIPSRVGPLDFTLDGLQISLVHGSREKPLSRYLYPWQVQTYLNTELKLIKQQLCKKDGPCVQFYGHTHVQMLVFANQQPGSDSYAIRPEKPLPQETYPIDDEFALINPGSVGQPRNLDQRACYCILDTSQKTVTFRRVPYDWRETARDLQDGAYARSWVNRLRTAAAIRETPDDWLAYYREAKNK